MVRVRARHARGRWFDSSAAQKRDSVAGIPFLYSNLFMAPASFSIRISLSAFLINN